MDKVYLDTSVVIEYVLATGREPEAAESILPPQAYEVELREYVESLLRIERRLDFATRLRSIVGWQFPEAEAVVSPFVLLELDEWWAAEVLKSTVVEVTHVKTVQKVSQKEIGKLIQRVERDSTFAEGVAKTPANHLWAQITNPPRGERLAGIRIETPKCLSFDEKTFNQVGLLATFQIGMADIVHLLAAQELRCTHFATKDSDFQRIRSDIEDIFDFKLLYNDEVFSVF